MTPLEVERALAGNQNLFKEIFENTLDNIFLQLCCNNHPLISKHERRKPPGGKRHQAASHRVIAEPFFKSFSEGVAEEGLYCPAGQCTPLSVL